MCDSVDQSEHPAPRQARSQRVPGMCIKCKTAKPNVSIRLSLYCKPCFVKAEIFKFRTALNKSRQKANQHGTKLMAASSGGPTSMAMLKLILDFHNVGRQGKTASTAFASVTVGHVDESALFPGCEDGVQRILQAEDVQVVTARLEDVFDSEEGLELVEKTVTPGAVRDKFVAQIVRQDPGVSPRERLKQLFSGLSTATNREDMLDSIKTFLIKKLAQSCGCRTLLLGDSGTRMATKVVTYTSRGRGYSLPFEVLGESQWGDIAVFRPMREWIAKEVAFFNRWTAQPSAVVPTFTTGAPAKASIDRLTESFIVALDRDFPSTVATICKTVTKLQPQDDAADAVHCLVCGMPAEAGAQTWRNRLTVSDVSSTESEGPVAAGAKPEPEPETKLAAGGIDITQRLCYSCQNLLHGAKPGTVLPEFSTHRYQTSDAAGLRKQIEEFLI